jgi:hypothetical protein
MNQLLLLLLLLLLLRSRFGAVALSVQLPLLLLPPALLLWSGAGAARCSVHPLADTQLAVMPHCRYRQQKQLYSGCSLATSRKRCYPPNALNSR